MPATRRAFLKTSAASALTFNIVPRRVLGGAGHTPPSEKITLAGIGAGGVGHPQLKDCAKAGFEIVSLCDVDDVHAKKTFDLFTEFVLLGNIALRTGKPIEYDAAAARITNVPEADALLRQPYHNGWTLA